MRDHVVLCCAGAGHAVHALPCLQNSVVLRVRPTGHPNSQRMSQDRIANHLLIDVLAQ